jgi:hypothetical protein
MAWAVFLSCAAANVGCGLLEGFSGVLGEGEVF